MTFAAVAVSACISSVGSGSMAVFEEQPFEQRLRDIHTVAQQSQGRQLHYESVGQILFGLEPENLF